MTTMTVHFFAKLLSQVVNIYILSFKAKENFRMRLKCYLMWPDIECWWSQWVNECGWIRLGREGGREGWSVVKRKVGNISAISSQEQVKFRWDDEDVCIYYRL